MAKASASKKSEIRKPLGRRISDLRRSQNMKLADIANICGVSEATMSRIETGQTNISAHHLFLLVRELGIDIADFFDNDARPLTAGMRSVTRARTGDVHTLARYVSEVLSSDISHKEMHPAINHITADTLDEIGGLWSHPGQEFLYVLNGAVELHTDLYVPLTLNEGDSVYFEGSMKHAYLKSGEETATILVVVAPSSRIFE